MGGRLELTSPPHNICFAETFGFHLITSLQGDPGGTRWVGALISNTGQHVLNSLKAPPFPSVVSHTWNRE